MSITYDKKSFIEIDALIDKIRKGNYQVFVFGTSKHAVFQASVLENFDIPINAYIDNNASKWETTFRGVDIKSPEAISKADNPLVVIANTFYTAMFQQLGQMNIKEVYIISNLIGYDFSQVLEDKKELYKYYGEPPVRNQEKILIKDWDGLGDLIMRLPLLEEMREQENADEKYHFITYKKSNYDILSKIFKNVFYFNKQEFIMDQNYRRDILEKIDKEYYSMAFNFFQEPSTTLELLNCYNTNIKRHENVFSYLEWKNGLFPEEPYMDVITRGIGTLLLETKRAPYDCKGYLGKYVADVIVKQKLPQKFIAIALGAATWKNAYKQEKAEKVMEQLLSAGLNIVLLGAGEEEEAYYYAATGQLKPYKNQIHNFCSRLTIMETLKVIERCSVFWGSDSALLHAAYSLDKRSVAAVSRVCQKRYKHNENNMIYLTADVMCSICGLLKCNYSIASEEYACCIGNVEPEQIANEILRMGNL